MKHLTAVVRDHLRWEQPRVFGRAWELRHGDDTVATLTFRSAFGSFAHGHVGRRVLDLQARRVLADTRHGAGGRRSRRPGRVRTPHVERRAPSRWREAGRSG
ncbi:MAG: hypothetical protein M0C28_23255 [Candidatus Moduliflexus flocculans]|nr:hypothetical protein [Candidatus Moduliflexus flocculans]